MFPMHRKNRRNLHRAGGFSIIAAVFLVVVVALIAAFLANIGAVQRVSSAYSVIVSRAHFAALSGVEWGAHEVLSNPVAPACLGTGQRFALDGAGSGHLDVSVGCRRQDVVEGG